MHIKGLEDLYNEKPKCIDDFLRDYGVASSYIYLMHDKTAVSYDGKDLTIKRLNRGRLKRKYGEDFTVSNDRTRDLSLLRSVSVDKALEEHLPNLKNNETIKNMLISMNRLCEELSFYKNTRRATNVWSKNLLQARFVVRHEDTSNELLGVLDCMTSFMKTVKGLNLKDAHIRETFTKDIVDYTEACRYITEWLIYTNILEIVISFITKGCDGYGLLMDTLPSKTGTRRYETFVNRLNDLDDVSVMLASELLKTTQNLDVKDFGKQKKEVLDHVFPFTIDYGELTAKTGLHTNVLKMISLLVAFIDTKNWGRLEFVEYYENLLSCLISSLLQDHVTEDKFQMYRNRIIVFHKKYGVKINKVKAYSKDRDANNYTKILETENMDFIVYRELIGTLSDMQKNMYDLRLKLEGEDCKLNAIKPISLENYQ